MTSPRARLAFAGTTFALTAAIAGAIVPSGWWLRALGVPADGPELIQGALLLRAALVVLGAYAAIGSRAGWWHAGSRGDTGGSTARFGALIGLICAIAVVLRLYRLGGGLWVDEVTTLVNYARGPFGRILTTYDSQNQHLLYSLMAHASFLIFGESSWALRLPAALFGIGGVWALYVLGAAVTSQREALLGATVLAVSYQHIWFSQSARGYSGLLMWALLSTWCLVRALRSTDRRLWLAYAAATALGVFTHQTMLFVALGQFVVYLAAVWRRTIADAWWVPTVSGFVPAALLTIASYALVLPQFPATTAKDVSTVATWLSPLWTVREMVAGLHLGAVAGIAAAGGVAVLLLGIRSYARTEPSIPILLVLPAVAGASITMAFGHPVWPRFFFFAAGFGVLVVVRGITELAALAPRLPGLARTRPAIVATALTLAIPLAGLPSFRFLYLPKQDFDGARDFVEGARAPGDAVVTAGVAAATFRTYFQPAWQPAASADEVNGVRAGSRRTWLLYTLPIEMRAEHADVMALVQRDFTLIREFGGTLGDGSIYVYRADSPGHTMRNEGR